MKVFRRICMKLLVLLLVTASVTEAQVWESGDNSTIKGCSTKCDMEDSKLDCWSKTLEFFEKSLIAQLRNYVSVQVNIDQWWRRHDKTKENGQNFNEVRETAKTALKSLILPGDVLRPETIEQVAVSLINQVERYSNRTISFVPHFACPLPCEYRHDMYRNLFIASVILNVCLAISVIPFIRRITRQYKENNLLMVSSS